MALQQVVEQIVTGLGYDLVEIERSAAGLLRITIDMPYVAGAVEQFVTVEDCEAVTRQLSITTFRYRPPGAHDGVALVHVPVYAGERAEGGLGAYGSWNVGNWCDDVQRRYLATLI